MDTQRFLDKADGHQSVPLDLEVVTWCQSGVSMRLLRKPAIQAMRFFHQFAVLVAVLSMGSVAFAQDACRCEIDDKGIRIQTLSRPSLIVKIDSNPPGADIWERETFLGTAPLELTTLSSGDHTFTLKLPHYETTQTLQIKGKGIQSYKLTLTEYPKLTMQLSHEMSSNLFALLSIDEEKVAFLPTTTHIAPGTHQLRVYAKDHVLWEQEIDMTTDKTETISLMDNVGYLDVGTTNFGGAWKYSNLVGAEVYVKSTSDDEHLLYYERRLGDIDDSMRLIGTTPIVRAKLRAGKYTISLRPQGCGQVESITYQVSVKRGVTTWAPAEYPGPVDRPLPGSDGDSSTEYWEKKCYEDTYHDDACVKVGYDLSHRELSPHTDDDLKAAMKAYERACNENLAAGCFGAAYLARRAKLRACYRSSSDCDSNDILAAGAPFLERARARANDSENAAMCWYQHVVDDIDPTPRNDLEMPHARWKRNTWAFDVTGLGGFSPWGVEPRYAEFGARLIAGSLYIGGTFRMMTLVQENDAKTPHRFERGAVIGSGIEMGAILGPESQAFYVRPAVRVGSTFLPDTGLTLGFGASIGRAFGNHVFELGAIYENMSSKVVTINVHGIDRVLTVGGVWGLMPFLQYSFRLTDE
jgi:hypothetical protein